MVTMNEMVLVAAWKVVVAVYARRSAHSMMCAEMASVMTVMIAEIQMGMAMLILVNRYQRSPMSLFIRPADMRENSSGAISGYEWSSGFDACATMCII